MLGIWLPSMVVRCFCLADMLLVLFVAFMAKRIRHRFREANVVNGPCQWYWGGSRGGARIGEESKRS